MSAYAVKISDPGSGLFPGPGTFPGPSTFPSAGKFVAYFCVQGSLQGSLTIGKRSTASFKLKTPLGTHFQQYQQVQILDGSGVLVFSGYIGQVTETKPGFQNSLLHQVQCMDQHWLADKRVIAKSYTNQSYDAIAYDIYKSILASEGVTVGQIGAGPYPGVYPGVNPSGSVLIPSATFVYCTVSKALDALVQQASVQGILFYWQIDENKKLWVVPYTAVQNAIVVDGTTIDQVNSPPQVTRQNPPYRNYEYVLSKVLQTSLKEETQPGDGSKRSWTFGYDIALAPTVFVNNIKQTIGIKGVDTGRQFYWQAGSPVITQDQGESILEGTDIVGVYYYGQHEGAISDFDQAEIEAQGALDGSTGIVDDVVRDDTITLAADGLAEGTQLLARYALRGTQLQFTTRTAGYAPGQSITVNLPVFNLPTTQMLAESVNFGDQIDNLNIWFTVNAIQGPYDITWADYESKALALPQPANSINVGV